MRRSSIRTSHIAVVFTLAALTAVGPSCVSPGRRTVESFGLPLVEIAVESENLAELNSTIGAKVPVPAAISIAGRKFAGRVNYAGKSTLDHYKKSFDLYFDENDLFRGRSAYRLSAQATDASAL